MKLHRFFVENKIENIFLKVKDSRILDQWNKVLRYAPQDKIIIFDGSSYDFDCIIEKISREEAVLQIIKKRKGLVLDKKITLYQSIIKKDKMEWVIEKATELGVSKIVPIISEKSEKKDLNLERAQKIAVEASEQCGRSDIPEIGNVLKLKDLFVEIPENGAVFDPSGVDLKSSILDTKYSELNLFIGPEGGWSSKELEMFKNLSIPIYSLGSFTLRAETATVVALAKFV